MIERNPAVEAAPKLDATKTFYQLEAANRRDSILLVVLALLILAMLGTLIGAVFTRDLVSGSVVAPFALALGGVWVLAAYREGDAMVIRATNAREADPVRDATLVDVVKEMSVAAGIPAPAAYVIPDSALNALATGRDPEHASIAVTSGLLDALSREELESVVAHEISHIRNLDTRYALLVAALVGAVVLIADIFLNSLRGLRYLRSNNKGVGAAVLVWVLIAAVFAILAPIFARLIQLAASRQREYLADASAVELARDPLGLESALLRIGMDGEVLEVANRGTQHLYFSNPIHGFEDRSRGLFSTHPSIADRVNRIRSLRSAPPLDASEVAALQRADRTWPARKPVAMKAPEPAFVPKVEIANSSLLRGFGFSAIKIGESEFKAPGHPVYRWADVASIDADPDCPDILRLWLYMPGRSEQRRVDRQVPLRIDTTGYNLPPLEVRRAIEDAFGAAQHGRTAGVAGPG